MKHINKTAIPEIVPSFRLQWETVQDCYVILYPEGMVRLSNSAGEIMKRINGQITVQDLIDEIQATCLKTDLETVETDIINFLGTAYENGWIKEQK